MLKIPDDNKIVKQKLGKATLLQNLLQERKIDWLNRLQTAAKLEVLFRFRQSWADPAFVVAMTTQI